MTFLVLFAIVGVALWGFFVVGNAASNSSETCYPGSTDPDTGGSCTFYKGDLCEWKSSGSGMEWKVNNENAFANAFGKDKGQTAVLTSPWMCGDIEIFCLRFRFMFHKEVGGNLTLLVCYSATVCTTVWSAASSDRQEGIWDPVSKSVSLTQRERFQIQFKAEKTRDRWVLTETDFYLDDILYKNTSCKEGVLGPASSTTVLFSTTGEKTTTTTTTTTDIFQDSSTLPTSVENDNQPNDDMESPGEENSPKLPMIAALLATLMLTAAIAVVVVYFRRQKSEAGGGSKKSSISRDPRSSIAMVTNALYYVSEWSQEPEPHISLREMPNPQDDDNYYSMDPYDDASRDQSRQLQPDVQVHHEHDNLCDADTYYSMIHHTDTVSEQNPHLDLEMVTHHRVDYPNDNYDNVVVDNGNVLL